MEGYQSSGSADVEMSMSDEPARLISAFYFSRGGSAGGRIHITDGEPAAFALMAPGNQYKSLKVFNHLGKVVLQFSGTELFREQNKMPLSNVNLFPGVYYWSLD